MTFSNKAIYIVGAKRTPFCYYGGFLRELQASQIFSVAAKEAMHSAKVNSIFVDQTIVGNVNYLSQCDGGKTPRYCGTYSGVPIDRPALGVNKACGSGLQAIISGAVDLLTGVSNITLVGGTEIMSSLPLLVRNVRFGTAPGSSYELEDHINRNLYDSYCKHTVQYIAEMTAKKHNINIRQVDEYTSQSFIKWDKANKLNVFSSELTEVIVNIKRKETIIDADQVMLQENIISGKAAADGAAALVLVSDEACKTHGLQPLARVVDWVCVGGSPMDSIAGIVSAMKILLSKNRLATDDVDLYEINETFASDVLAISKELKLDLNRVNVNGGALALGDPVAATGARMATHLVHELKRRGMKRGITASSCGAGQGVAVMIKRE